MKSPVRKFKFLEAALIVTKQFPESTVMIGEDFYAVGRKSLFGWSILREDGFMVVPAEGVAK